MKRPGRCFSHVLSFLAGCTALLCTAPAWAEPVITEFLAQNRTVLKDDDGDYSDWLEIYNPDSSSVNLAGWALTDDVGNKGKWKFPEITLPPQGFMVVYASNKNRRDATKPLHTNFALSAEGEYLGLIKPDGTTVVSAFSPTFPAQAADVSYGVTQPIAAGEAAETGYFSKATPGARNGDRSTLLVLETVAFSRPSGLFSDSLTLGLTGASPGQKIRYVVAPPSANGAEVSEPTATSPEFAGPITIAASSIVRAAVFSADGARRGASTVAEFVRLQTTGDQRVDGFWSQLPILVLDNHGLGALEAGQSKQDSWIHVQSAESGQVARLTSASSLSSPITAKVRGSTSALFPKKGYNISFQTSAGSDDEASLLGMPAATDWALVSPWSYDRSYVHNAFVYALSTQLGQWAPRTQFAELFCNWNGGNLDLSDYIGVVVASERIEIAPDRLAITPLSNSDVTGGYVLKLDAPDSDEFWFRTSRGLPELSGTAVVVDSVKADKLSDAQKSYITNYVQEMENALFADRDRNWATRDYLNYIDRAAWIDHHVLNQLVGNVDAFQRSSYFYKDRGGKLIAGPAWDYDRALGSPDPRNDSPEGWGMTPEGIEFWKIGWWGVLAQDPGYMQAWIDRWQHLRRTTLSTDNLDRLADTFAGQIGSEAAARDAARWPDNVGRFPGGFAGEVAHLKDWLMLRAVWIDQQFAAAPAQRADAGVITLTPPAGARLVYTLNGSDPRAVDGSLASGVLESDGAVALKASDNYFARSYRADLVGAFPGSPWSSPRTAGGSDDADGVRQSAGLLASSRLSGLSTRAFVEAGETVLIAGINVRGDAPKTFLARAIGPSLSGLGVQAPLADPLLRIVDQNGAEIARNSGWGTADDANALPDITASAGTFPLAAGSRDAAMTVTLAPGNYTMLVSSATNLTGTALVELYETTASGEAAALSSRAFVRSGENIVIGGIAITGSQPARVLIRGLGPGLGQVGVSGFISDPVVTVYRGDKIIATNDNWEDAGAGTVNAAGAAQAGTFAFAAGSRDAAMIVSLEPGPYTIQITSKSGVDGVGMVEVYRLP